MSTKRGQGDPGHTRHRRAGRPTLRRPGREGLAHPHCRHRDEKRTALLLGQDPHQLPRRDRGTLAAGLPLPEKPHRPGLLHLPRTRERHPDRLSPCRQGTLGHRGNLTNLQRQNRARPLPSAPIHRLISPHHPRHGRPRLPQHHLLKKGGPHQSSEQLVRLSLPEIRQHVIRIVWHREPDPTT